MSFKVGDVCVLIVAKAYPEMVNAECTIVQLGGTPIGDCQCHFPLFPSRTRTRLWSIWFADLRKKPPNKDEFVAGEWELCPWQPNKERA